MVPAIDAKGSQNGPSLSVRIPQFSGKNRARAVIKTGTTAATGHQHSSIWQYRRICLASGVVHGLSVAPSGNGGIDVDDLCRSRRWIRATDFQYLAVVVHHSWTIVTKTKKAVWAHYPCACARRVQEPRKLIRACVKYEACVGKKHSRVCGKIELRGRQITPAMSRQLENLGK